MGQCAPLGFIESENDTELSDDIPSTIFQVPEGNQNFELSSFQSSFENNIEYIKRPRTQFSQDSFSSFLQVKDALLDFFNSEKSISEDMKEYVLMKEKELEQSKHKKKKDHQSSQRRKSCKKKKEDESLSLRSSISNNDEKVGEKKVKKSMTKSTNITSKKSHSINKHHDKNIEENTDKDSTEKNVGQCSILKKDEKEEEEENAPNEDVIIINDIDSLLASANVATRKDQATHAVYKSLGRHNTPQVSFMKVTAEDACRLRSISDSLSKSGSIRSSAEKQNSFSTSSLCSVKNVSRQNISAHIASRKKSKLGSSNSHDSFLSKKSLQSSKRNSITESLKNEKGQNTKATITDSSSLIRSESTSENFTKYELNHDKMKIDRKNSSLCQNTKKKNKISDPNSVGSSTTLYEQNIEQKEKRLKKEHIQKNDCVRDVIIVKKAFEEIDVYEKNSKSEQKDEKFNSEMILPSPIQDIDNDKRQRGTHQCGSYGRESYNNRCKKSLSPKSPTWRNVDQSSKSAETWTDFELPHSSEKVEITQFTQSTCNHQTLTENKSFHPQYGDLSLDIKSAAYLPTKSFLEKEFDTEELEHFELSTTQLSPQNNNSGSSISSSFQDQSKNSKGLTMNWQNEEQARNKSKTWDECNEEENSASSLSSSKMKINSQKSNEIEKANLFNLPKSIFDTEENDELVLHSKRVGNKTFDPGESKKVFYLDDVNDNDRMFFSSSSSSLEDGEKDNQNDFTCSEKISYLKKTGTESSSSILNFDAKCVSSNVEPMSKPVKDEESLTTKINKINNSQKDKIKFSDKEHRIESLMVMNNIDDSHFDSSNFSIKPTTTGNSCIDFKARKSPWRIKQNLNQCSSQLYSQRAKDEELCTSDFDGISFFSSDSSEVSNTKYNK